MCFRSLPSQFRRGVQITYRKLNILTGCRGKYWSWENAGVHFAASPPGIYGGQWTCVAATDSARHIRTRHDERPDRCRYSVMSNPEACSVPGKLDGTIPGTSAP